MPATLDTCKKLIQRLRSLKFAGTPEDASGLRQEAGRTLMSASESDAHAEAIVEAIMRECRDFPAPADIWRVAENTPPPLGRAQAGCGHCGGSGFEYIAQRTVRMCRCRKAAVSV